MKSFTKLAFLYFLISKTDLVDHASQEQLCCSKNTSRLTGSHPEPV